MSNLKTDIEPKVETNMKITVEMRMVDKDSTSPLKARASVVFNDCFVIHNVRLVNVGNGMFISMPSYKRGDGVWRNICHPIKRELTEQIKAAMIEAYDADERE